MRHGHQVAHQPVALVSAVVVKEGMESTKRWNLSRKMLLVDLAEINRRIAEIDLSKDFDLIFDLLDAYGVPKASLTRLRTGTYNRSDRPGECLWTKKVFYRFVGATDDVHVTIDHALSDPRVVKERPRFLIVTDKDRLVAIDTRTDDTLDIPRASLAENVAFFLPLAGIEKAALEKLNYANVKAAEKMARLYDEIIAYNAIAGGEEHSLNVFFSRLLFCFFAEDTQVFSTGQFSNVVASLTLADGSDVHSLLTDVFNVLNTEPTARDPHLPSHLRDFPFVNGNLFNERIGVPRFSAKARRIVLECATLDWSRINPDIFGSMIQAVVHPSQRGGLGMHYTSVENIMKVIRPLFLDDLRREFDASAMNVRKLERLLARISGMKFFDPACGSGNFLVIAYKELRALEQDILLRLIELEPSKRGLFKLSGIKLENFFGIEIDDFAHEIAILSLWLAKHQMNIEFYDLFGVEIALIPLKDSGNIVCANAARIAWESVCMPRPGDEVFLLGNPPYQGGTKQSAEQKEDLVLAFEDVSINKYLDYVSIWLFKGARFAVDYGAELGFVTTNSVCQGNHVGLLWPRLHETGVEISFAHAPFLWTNNAKGNAGVTCIVLGLSLRGRRASKVFYQDGTVRTVSHINHYLVPGGRDVVVTATDTNQAGLPAMVFGSMPRDGGHLLLEAGERDQLMSESPGAERFLRRYMGAEEFLHGRVRYCLWIQDNEVSAAETIPEIARRLDRVRLFREGSKAASTRKHAATPHRFVQLAHEETSSIIVPGVSSQTREYVPMGFLDERTVISNAAHAIYGAEPWVLGVIQSRMHMVWMRAVAGRMKSDYRYSPELVYNTFPTSAVPMAVRSSLTERVLDVLQAREAFPEKSIAQQYRPGEMPPTLRAAHERLDATVDGLFREQPFATDEERLEHLFDLYERSALTGMVTTRA